MCHSFSSTEVRKSVSDTSVDRYRSALVKSGGLCQEQFHSRIYPPSSGQLGFHLNHARRPLKPETRDTDGKHESNCCGALQTFVCIGRKTNLSMLRVELPPRLVPRRVGFAPPYRPVDVSRYPASNSRCISSGFSFNMFCFGQHIPGAMRAGGSAFPNSGIGVQRWMSARAREVVRQETPVKTRRRKPLVRSGGLVQFATGQHVQIGPRQPTQGWFVRTGPARRGSEAHESLCCGAAVDVLFST